jgi:hypothetical protein
MRQLVRVFIAPPPFDAGTREGLAQSAGDHGAAHSARAGPLRAFNCRPNRRISTPGVGRVTFAFATRCAAGGLARPTLAPKKCAGPTSSPSSTIIHPDNEIWYGAPTFKQAKRVMWNGLKRNTRKSIAAQACRLRLRKFPRRRERRQALQALLQTLLQAG